MIISKLILAKLSLTSHLSYNSQNFGILLNNCLSIMVLISIYHCLVRVCARACVWGWGWACVSVFCMPVLYAVCWMVWMFLVLLFYVIYSGTIASIANVFCWLYPTLNKVYLILSYLILSLIPAWISNHMSNKAWDEITYPFPNFNGCTVDGWEWISNFIPHLIMDVVTYPCWD